MVLSISYYFQAGKSSISAKYINILNQWIGLSFELQRARSLSCNGTMGYSTASDSSEDPRSFVT